MRWALVTMRLWPACRNTSVRRTTGTAPDEMTSASTWPGPTEGSWSVSPTTKRAALSGTAFMSASLGHAFGGAAGRSAQQEGGALRRDYAQDGLDDGSLADAGTAGHDQHLGHQREPDRCYLALGEGKPDTLLDPRQGLVRIDPGPRQRAICQSHQPLGDGALRPVQARQKHTGRLADPVGDH